MNEDRKNILVGALTLVTLFVLGSATFGGKSIGAAARGYIIQAGFNRIDGLNVGDDVRLSGIKIGEVARMRLGPHFAAVVDLRIDTPVGLPTDTSAAIHTDGLFGAKHVVLVPGADEKNLGPGGRIDLTQDSVVVSDLLDLIIGEAKSNAAKRDATQTPQPAPGEGQGKPSGLLAPLLGDPPPAEKGDVQ